MKLKKVFLSCFLMASLVLVGCSKTLDDQSKSENSKSKENITIGTTANLFPLTFSEDNKLQGYEIDIWEEIGKRTGREIKWEVMGFDGLFGALDSGQIDTVANQISITDTRKEKYDFSEVYSYNEIKMVVKEGDSAKNLEDLHGKKIAIEPNSVLSEFFENYNKDKDKKDKMILDYSDCSAWEEIGIGRIDAFPMTVLSFDSIKEKGNYKVKLIGDAIITEENAYPFNKSVDKELLTDVNNAIKDMHEDGTLSNLSEKWFNIDITKSI